MREEMREEREKERERGRNSLIISGGGRQHVRQC